MRLLPKDAGGQVYPPNQANPQQSGCGLERRSSKMSALCLLQKSRSKRYAACSDMCFVAEKDAGGIYCAGTSARH